MKAIVFIFTVSLFLFSGIISEAQERDVPKATEKENTFIVNVDFHCGGGKNRLESGLGKLDGVKSVEADLKTKNVTVKHDSDEISTEEIVLAIEKIGHRTEFTPESVKIRHACTHNH